MINKMKTRILVLLSILFCGLAYAQEPESYFDQTYGEPVIGEDNLTIECVIFIDGEQITGPDYNAYDWEIASFSVDGNIHRGTGWVKSWHNNAYFGSMFVCGGVTGEIQSFKLYNHNTGQTSDGMGLLCTTTIEFTVNAIIGTTASPFEINFVTPATCTFTNFAGNNWSTATNWSPRIPASCDDAVIAANSICVIDDDATVAYKTLTIKDGAQFFAPSDATIEATVEKFIAAYTPNTKNNYYFVSSPITTELNYNTFESVGMLQGDYDLYSFEQDPDDDLEWQNFKEMEELEADFAGYLYANAQNTTLSFNGTLFLDLEDGEDIYTKLTYDEDYPFPGFNLVGNPYPSNAKVTSTTSGKIDGFYTLNEGRNEVVACASDEPVVAPCTALFAVANATKAKLSFAPIQGEDADARNSQSCMCIEVFSNEMLKDRACVKFSEGNNLQKFTLNPEATHIFFREDGKDYAIVQGNERMSQLPLFFETREYGQYTINVKLENLTCEYLHLIDNLTGMDVDLLATPSYTFQANSSDYAARFKIVFEGTGVEENTANESFAIVEGNRVIIPAIEHESTLEVIDMTGRTVSSQKVNGSFDQTLNVKAGIYMLRLNGMTQKIVVE